MTLYLRQWQRCHNILHNQKTCENTILRGGKYVNTFRKISLLVAILAMPLSLASCGHISSSSSTPIVECTDLTFKGSGYDEGKTIYLERLQSTTIAATISPSNVTNKVIVWSTSNPDIAVESKTDTQGIITAYDLGSAKITATCGSYSEDIDVECVDAVLPTSLSLTATTLSIAITKREKIEYSFEPANVSNTKIACTVSPIGTAQEDMAKIEEENGNYYIAVTQLAAVGDQYLVTVRAAAKPELKKTITVTVAALEVETMVFKNADITLKLSDPLYRVLPIFTPIETTYRDVTFQSSDEAICSVDAIGTLSAKAVGSVIITATNVHNPSLTCQANVTIQDGISEYATRLIKNSDLDALAAKDYTVMDFETDKVAFASWQKKLSEDSNTTSHVSDAGWAIWMVGFDTYDDDSLNGGDANAVVYCKLNVPADSAKMQYVFRAHPFPDDHAKFKILAITSDHAVTECTGGWVIMSNTTDMFIDIDVAAFAGQAVTFVVMQDQIGNKSAGNYMGVSLMFRRCLFDTDTSERWVEDPTFSILEHQN